MAPDASTRYDPLPEHKPARACEPGELRFAAIGLDHGHIFEMARGLVEAGGEAALVYDPDPAKVGRFQELFPAAGAARSREEVLESDVQLVASAAVPSERGSLGLETHRHGKAYLSDKAPFTNRDQLDAARRSVQESKLPWFVCYGERVHNEAAVHAGALIEAGAIGRVLQVLGTGPHRLNLPSRPDWFFRKSQYGGILVDIGSHQIEQFLSFAGASEARVLHSKVANYAHPEFPELEDFGDATLLADNGATCYFRVDWFTPKGLGTWGDGRTIVLGTEGYIELRKNIDVARSPEGDHLFLVNGEGEMYIPCRDRVGYPYFGALIRDCLDGTDNAMPQAHTFRAAELSLAAQEQALIVGDT